ncbi:MAG: mandelate racemase/muconate lactonizing enzyme family protein [Anaerolineae bacterium]|nr:mandelate racemase/muconate lactonizing enzyme family protein [Anaerolineae bacterium]
MRITQIDCTFVRVPFSRPYHPAWLPGEVEHSRTYNLMRIHTDEGLVGVSPGPAQSVVDRASAYLVGQDPLDLQAHLQFLRRLRFGGMSVGGIENALWDLVGKIHGLPLYRLFGGRAERFMAYASLTEVGAPEGRAEDALRFLERGYRAIKLRLRGIEPREGIRLVEAVRQAVGQRMAIMVDANQAHVTVPGSLPTWSLQTATWVARELEQLDVLWLEEPLTRYEFDHLHALCEAVEIPIAGGESLPALDVFKLALDKGAYDILQPDAVHGISQQLRLTVLAEAYHTPLVPHTAPGSVYANMHVMAASASPMRYLEFIDDPPVFPAGHFYDLVCEEDAPWVDPEGTIGFTGKPGLGYDWNLEAARRYPA